MHRNGDGILTSKFFFVFVSCDTLSLSLCIRVLVYNRISQAFVCVFVFAFGHRRLGLGEAKMSGSAQRSVHYARALLRAFQKEPTRLGRATVREAPTTVHSSRPSTLQTLRDSDLQPMHSLHKVCVSSINPSEWLHWICHSEHPVILGLRFVSNT